VDHDTPTPLEIDELSDELASALDDEEELVKVHPPARRVVALIIAGCLLAMTIFATGFSLLRAPPTPSRTRPLPLVVPAQGAIH
jgi:hypothetical protein